MALIYGNYPHDPGEAAFAISRDGIFSPDGIAQGYLERWDISGRLHAADHASLTTKINALTQAYSVNGLDLGLYLDDNTPTAHAMVSANTIGGTRVVRRPSFPESKGSHDARRSPLRRVRVAGGLSPILLFDLPTDIPQIVVRHFGTEENLIAAMLH